jgi:uncharacterized cupin superfamily protein
MAIIRKGDVPETEARSTYPAPYTLPSGRMRWQALGDAGGLTQYGVARETLDPGAQSSQMHWEDREDELLYMLEGELTVIEDGVATIIGPGDTCAWKAGSRMAHCLRNHTAAPAVYLMTGSRDARNATHYPGLDLIATPDGYTHLDGTPYAPKPA